MDLTTINSKEVDQTRRRRILKTAVLMFITTGFSKRLTIHGYDGQTSSMVFVDKSEPEYCQISDLSPPIEMRGD